MNYIRFSSIKFNFDFFTPVINKSNIFCQSCSDSPSNTISTAYSNMLILNPPIYIPRLRELTLLARSFIKNIIKKVGESVSHCFTPLSILNQSVSILCTLTAQVASL